MVGEQSEPAEHVLKLYFSDHFVIPLPEGHRFPIDKYALLRRRVESDGLYPQVTLTVPEAASEADLLRVHTPDYVAKVLDGRLNEREIRRIGFPWSPGLVQRSLRSVGGTIAAGRAALKDGLAANLAGGTHHAYADHGEGFCVFNDTAVAARALQAAGLARRVVILDCDVHQGNGTAAIFADDDSVFTFSIHGMKNFPFHKEPSDLDIGLEDGASDEAFLEAAEHGVRESIDRARADLAFYIAGADPFWGDRLGRLAVSKSGLAQRDEIVFEACQRAGLPAAIVMGGGYAKQIDDTVDIHFQTLKIAARRQQAYDHLQRSPE